MWYWKLYSEEDGLEIFGGYFSEVKARQEIQHEQSKARICGNKIIYCYSEPYYREE